MAFFKSWFKSKPEVVPVVPIVTQFRIIKEQYEGRKAYFYIEVFERHYACEEPIWLSAWPARFDTHEEASKILDDMLKPPVRPTQVVVEERSLES